MVCLKLSESHVQSSHSEVSAHWRAPQILPRCRRHAVHAQHVAGRMTPLPELMVRSNAKSSADRQNTVEGAQTW